MNTYIFLSGETIRYREPSLELADFLARVQVAANDPNVSIPALMELIYGLENPILDKTILPGRAMVTKAVMDNPVYQILLDLIDRKRLQLGLLDPDVARSAFTMSVPEAARKLRITSAAVRAAINARRLSGVFENGQWWIRPKSVASYKVSTRGPKGKRRKVRR